MEINCASVCTAMPFWTTLQRQSACLVVGVVDARLDWSYILADCLALGPAGRQGPPLPGLAILVRLDARSNGPFEGPSQNNPLGGLPFMTYT